MNKLILKLRRTSFISLCIITSIIITIQSSNASLVDRVREENPGITDEQLIDMGLIEAPVVEAEAEAREEAGDEGGAFVNDELAEARCPLGAIHRCPVTKLVLESINVWAIRIQDLAHLAQHLQSRDLGHTAPTVRRQAVQSGEWPSSLLD